MKKQALALSVLAAVSSQAGAFQFDTGDDWNIRWDNSFKANIMTRVEKQSPDVYDNTTNRIAAQLADDSTLSVDRGSLISTRLDVFSELDVIYKRDYGFRISASAWYDPAYKDSDNRKKGFLQNGFPTATSSWGQLSVKPNDYSDDAKDLHYAGGELLDAFLFANFDITEDIAANIRLGRHTLYWGQSLLSTAAITGIAGSMASLDLSKGFGAPGSEAKELFMPNGKISTVAQLSDNLTFNAFYAFEHLVHRFPESGTYFSPAEVLTEDSEFLTAAAGPTRLGFQVRDDKYKDSGEWGVNFQYFVDAWNLETSFVYISATDRSPSGLYGSFGGVTPEDAAKGAKTGAVTLGYYGWVYKNEIDVYGISLSKEIAGISMGMDVVYRENAPINPDLARSLQAHPESYTSWKADGQSARDYPGAVGDVYTVVINGLGLLNNNLGLWDGGSYIVEAYATKLADFSYNEFYASDGSNDDIGVNKGRWVSGIALVFKPTWFQVFPGWDMSVPFSLGYTIDGEQSALSLGGNEEVGSGGLGVEFAINETWNFTAKYNFFFGPALNGTGGLLKDRDNISLTLKRTL